MDEAWKGAGVGLALRSDFFVTKKILTMRREIEGSWKVYEEDQRPPGHTARKTDHTSR